MSGEKEHCRLDRMLTPEEMERMRDLFRQQGINMPDNELMAHVQKSGNVENCPFRYNLGQGVDLCVSRCYLSDVAKEQCG